LFLSTATIWELAIKVGLQKLSLSGPFHVYLTAAINGFSIKLLPISIEDCASYVALPFPRPAHRDPFDRLMIVHAVANGLSIVSADAAFDSYGVTRLW
jgi:PIN domain nuclease of toxin-antitoxin system